MLPGKVADILFKGKASSFELFYRLSLTHFVDSFDGYIRIFSPELYQNQLTTRLERFQHGEGHLVGKRKFMVYIHQ